MSIPDQSTILFMVYWLANVNAYKTSFWLLSYILTSSPSFLAALKQETSPALLPSSPHVDISYLASSEKCPLLNAAFDETVRLTNSASSVRAVVQDTTINGKFYRKGAKIMMPYRQLHFNEAIFGPSNPQAFDPGRFLHNKDLARSPSYKPFGGGSTLCSGRFVARYEVLAFVALLVNRFDVSLVEGQRFPRFDRSKPGLGIMETKQGDDLRIELRPVTA